VAAAGSSLPPNPATVICWPIVTCEPGVIAASSVAADGGAAGVGNVRAAGRYSPETCQVMPS
jgi:hypothetical protein